MPVPAARGGRYRDSGALRHYRTIPPMNFTDYLFDTPWWLPTAVVFVGGFVFYTANKRQETRLRTIGLLIACLGLALVAVSYGVDTDLERAEKQSRRIVAAVDDGDWAALGALLHANTSLTILDGVTLYRGGPTIAKKAQEAYDRYGIRDITITALQARQDQTLITVSLSVMSTQEQTMLRPVPSTWEFDWLEAADGWYLNEIRAVEVARQRGQGMESMFPRR